MGKRFGLPHKTQLQLAQGAQWSHHSVQGLNNQKAAKLVRPLILILISYTSGSSQQLR